jgi:hypothetical protein
MKVTGDSPVLFAETGCLRALFAPLAVVIDKK